MYNCEICGSKSRLFLNLNDLHAHMNTYHRSWLHTSRSKNPHYVGETEEEIAEQINKWLYKNEWQMRLATRRPWYTVPEYSGPKTLLEERLNHNYLDRNGIAFSRGRQMFYENELDKKHRELNKIINLVKERQNLTEQALKLAKDASTTQKNFGGLKNQVNFMAIDQRPFTP